MKIQLLSVSLRPHQLAESFCGAFGEEGASYETQGSKQKQPSLRATCAHCFFRLHLSVCAPSPNPSALSREGQPAQKERRQLGRHRQGCAMEGKTIIPHGSRLGPWCGG